MATANAMSTYLSNELLDHMLGNGGYTRPTNIYVALYSAAPSDAGGGTELSGNGYARVNASAKFETAASGGIISNDGAITFGPATAAWSAATHFGILDASPAGNLLFWGALDTARTVGLGDSAEFAIGALDIDMSATDNLTTAGANKILDHVFGVGTAWGAVTPYVALHTANPTEAGNGAEVANSGAYARKAMDFGAASAESCTQGAQVDFTTATGSWGTVTHAAIWDSGTYGAGTCLLYWDVTDVAVGNGDTYYFPASTVVVTLD